MSQKNSADPGQWQTKRTPVAYGPMLAVTEPLTHTVTVMAGTQIMKSEFLINVACYYIHQEPSSILFVQPKIELAENFSKERFTPTRDVTDVIRELVPEARNRDSGVTVSHKEYPGGTLDFVGANSPTDLSSRPKRIVLCDEIDKYPPSAGKEGDPMLLAEERSSRFWNRKKVRCCSPTFELTSRIAKEYKLSDMRQCFVACPHCGVEQTLKWANVKWPKDENDQDRAEAAEYLCEACGVLWGEGERINAIRSIIDRPDHGWRQTKPFKCCGVEQVPSVWSERGRSLCVECGQPSRYRGHAGFMISKLYSTSHKFADIAQEWLDAQGDPEKLKKFVNTALAETWKEEGEVVDAAGLRTHVEPYGPDDLPDAAHYATMGVDTHPDRLECEIVAWGEGDESWGVRYEVLYGDPAQQHVWKQLDELRREKFWTVSGRLVRIRSCCIDSGGHHGAHVIAYARSRFNEGVYPIRGAGGPRPVWPKHASKSTNTHENIWIVGVDTAKDAIYGRFKIAEPGPGYCHLPQDYDDVWFEQATAESVVTRYKEGKPFRVWVLPSGRRNEALDCRVYAYAARLSLKPTQTQPSTVKAADKSEKQRIETEAKLAVQVRSQPQSQRRSPFASVTYT